MLFINQMNYGPVLAYSYHIWAVAKRMRSLIQPYLYRYAEELRIHSVPLCLVTMRYCSYNYALFSSHFNEQTWTMLQQIFEFYLPVHFELAAVCSLGNGLFPMFISVASLLLNFICCAFKRILRGALQTAMKFSNGCMLSVTLSEVTEHKKVGAHTGSMPARQLSHCDCRFCKGQKVSGTLGGHKILSNDCGS